MPSRNGTLNHEACGQYGGLDKGLFKLHQEEKRSIRTQTSVSAV